MAHLPETVLAVVVSTTLAGGCGAANGPESKTPDSAAQGDMGTEGLLEVEKPPGRDGESADRAVALMDKGEFERAERIWKDVLSRHPDNALVRHELALTYRLLERPGEAVDLLARYEARLPAPILAGYASALDEAQRSDEARAVLKRGLERFPDSGLLHSELGTVWRAAGQIDRALPQYEKGIAVEPAWPTNYLHAAGIYATSKTPAMALIYGEVFRLLEPSSKRSAKMALLLVELYRRAVTIESRDPLKATVALSANPVAMAGDSARVTLPGAYEIAIGLPLIEAHAEGLRIETLHRARVKFLEIWHESEAPDRQHPLFSWQKRVLDAGHFEAYDHWLLAPAFPDEATAWAAAHEPEMGAMNEFVSQLAYP